MLSSQEMIENYVHWNEDIGEWQLVSSVCMDDPQSDVQFDQHHSRQFGCKWMFHFELVLFLNNVFQKCVAYTGNNMRKQTPAPDKKEKDVSCRRLF